MSNDATIIYNENDNGETDNVASREVSFSEIKTDKGHDSFLLDVPDFLSSIRNFLEANY